MSAHICEEGKGCVCSLQALEPDEDCPVHGPGPWPPRCASCGKFMPWACRDYLTVVEAAANERSPIK